MAELTPQSDRKHGVYARVHAAQKRLSALIFMAPDAPVTQAHTAANYQKYYKKPTIVYLPNDTEKAKETIISTLEDFAREGRFFHTVLFEAHGRPNGVSIAGKGKGIAATDLLHIMGDIKRRTGVASLARDAIFLNCNILANADDSTVVAFSQAVSEAGIDRAIASSSTSYPNAQPSRNHRDYVTTGDYYQITKDHKFIPYYDFRDNEADLEYLRHETEKDGYDTGLVATRAEFNKECSRTAPSDACSKIANDYNQYIRYMDARKWLSEHAKAQPEEKAAHVKTIYGMLDKLNPNNKRLAILMLAQHADAQSPLLADAIKQGIDLVPRNFSSDGFWLTNSTDSDYVKKLLNASVGKPITQEKVSDLLVNNMFYIGERCQILKDLVTSGDIHTRHENPRIQSNIQSIVTETLRLVKDNVERGEPSDPIHFDALYAAQDEMKPEHIQQMLGLIAASGGEFGGTTDDRPLAVSNLIFAKRNFGHSPGEGVTTSVLGKDMLDFSRTIHMPKDGPPQQSTSSTSPNPAAKKLISTWNALSFKANCLAKAHDLGTDTTRSEVEKEISSMLRDQRYEATTRLNIAYVLLEKKHQPRLGDVIGQTITEINPYVHIDMKKNRHPPRTTKQHQPVDFYP